MNDGVPRMKKKPEEPQTSEVKATFSCLLLFAALAMVCVTVLASVYIVWG